MLYTISRVFYCPIYLGPILLFCFWMFKSSRICGVERLSKYVSLGICHARKITSASALILKGLVGGKMGKSGKGVGGLGGDISRDRILYRGKGI